MGLSQERQAGALIASNLYEAFDEKTKLLPKGQEAVNEFVKVQISPFTIVIIPFTYVGAWSQTRGYGVGSYLLDSNVI